MLNLFKHDPEKEEEEAEELLLQALLKPDSVIIEKDRISIGDTLNRVLMAAGYPRKVSPGFLDKIIRSKGNFDVCLHVQPYSAEQKMVELNNLLRKLNADKYSAQKNRVLTPSLDLKIRDTRKVLDQLQSGREKLFDVGLYVNVKAFTKQELGLLTSQIKADLNSVMIVPKCPVFKMRAAMQSMLPIGLDLLRMRRTLTTSALSACFPFTSAFLEADETGVMLATNKLNSVPIIKDIFSFPNYNILLLGSSGSGKSYSVKLNLIRYFMAGTQVFVIDPEAEYVELTRAVDGQIVEISRDSDTIINVFDLLGQRLDDKRLSLLSAFNILFGGLSEPQVAILDKAVTETYARKGIQMSDPSTWVFEPPVLGDLFAVLSGMKSTCGRRDHPTFDALLNRLERYTTGVFSFMNKQTQLDFSKDFICFDIQKMPSSVQPLMMYMILEYVYTRMHADRARKILVIDEAWSLLSHADSSAYIFKIVKTARKYNLAFMLITQEVNDLLGSRAGDSVLANTSCKYLLKQDPSVIKRLVEKLNLTVEEKNLLLTCSVGEGILIADKDRVPVKIIASEKEDELITTKADVLRERELRKEKEKPRPQKARPVNAEKKLDLEKGLYRLSDLSKEEASELLCNGYVQTKQRGFDVYGVERYLIKPVTSQARESIDHLFLVKLIAAYLLNYTDKVELFMTKGPDLVFENAAGDKVAVEVETGGAVGKYPGKLRKKVEDLKKEYGSNWFFVLTKAKHKPFYDELGKVITRPGVPARIRREFGE